MSYDLATKRVRAVFNPQHQYFLDLKYGVQVSSKLQTWTSIATVGNGSSFTNFSSQSISAV